MKKLFFILLAGALSFSSVGQEFGGNSMSKRHKSSHSKPKKHKAKKVKKKKEKSDK